MQKKSKIEKEGTFKEEKAPQQENIESAGEKEPKEKNLQERLEGYADSAVRAIGYERLKIWKEVFFHPTKTLTEEMKNKNLMRGAKDVFVSYLIFLLLGFIYILLFLLVLGQLGIITTLLMPKELSLVPVITVIIIGIIIILAYFAAPIVAWLFVSTLQYITARLLGGKGDFTTHAYLVALSIASAIVATIPFVFLELVPCIGIFAAAVRTVIILYGLYLQYKAIKTAHSIGTVQAVVALFIPYIVIVAIVLILWLLIYFGLLSLAFLPIFAQAGTVN